MKGFLNLMALFFIILLFVIVYQLYKKGITEEAQEKKKRLLKERESRVNENQQKEKLRDYLERKFKIWLYPGYTFLIISFLGFSTLFTLLLFPEFNAEKMFLGGAVTEIVLMIITLYFCQKTHEFKFILNQFAPFLRKKVFGENINIDSEIEKNYVRINEIDDEIKELDKMIVA